MHPRDSNPAFNVLFWGLNEGALCGRGAVPSVALRRNKTSLPPPPEKYVGLKIEIEGFSLKDAFFLELNPQLAVLRSDASITRRNILEEW